jgi:UTP--glucose-1-phosphate uridylyltransferase
MRADIFEALEKTKLGRGGELWLVDAIFKLLKKRPVYACAVEGTYYDTGSKLGYLKANVEFALRDPSLSKEFKQYLKSVIFVPFTCILLSRFVRQISQGS